MRLGICTSPDSLADASAAGFDFAELACSFLLPEQDETAYTPVRQALRAAPIPVEAFNVFLPSRLKVTGPEVNPQAVAAYMDLVLRRASEAGATIMVFGSGGARQAPDGFPVEIARNQFVAAARLAGEIAARHGMTVVLEPLLKRACNLFNRTEQGIVYVDRVNHPRVRLLTDLYHMSWEAEPFDNLVKAGTRLAHIHLATPSLPETGSDNGPLYDLAGFLGALRRAGYEGRLSVEDNPGLLGKTNLPRAEVYAAVRRHVAACLAAGA
jgi:D-psicose/D-tagatose/L-ribulose 3-epimerase